MKKYLLTDKKNFYKANLHCHSTVSDGRKTPEELKEMYLEQGYSIIAYTDHDVLIGHGELCDDKFLALNGYELGAGSEGVIKTCHLCFIALEPDNLTQFCYHREKYLFGNAPKYRPILKFDPEKPDFEREYSPECINTMIAEGRKNGFFVTYNHPVWSLEDMNDYGKYTGMHAMEMCNYGCLVEGYPEYNERVYDDMLRGGERIFCISTDDNHNHVNDSFGGFTVINAERLEYKTVTDALLKGDFYASMGPMINELWYEDGKIGISCSSAARISLSTGVRRCQVVHADGKNELNGAVFDVRDGDVYVRITVMDPSGKYANTNAYFVDDLKR